MPDSMHDEATLISRDRPALNAFLAAHGLPLRVAMVLGPYVDPAEPAPPLLTDQLLAGYHAKNQSLAPWLGHDGRVYSLQIFHQLLDVILAPPFASPVILLKPFLRGKTPSRRGLSV